MNNACLSTLLRIHCRISSRDLARQLCSWLTADISQHTVLPCWQFKLGSCIVSPLPHQFRLVRSLSVQTILPVSRTRIVMYPLLTVPYYSPMTQLELLLVYPDDRFITSTPAPSEARGISLFSPPTDKSADTAHATQPKLNVTGVKMPPASCAIAWAITSGPRRRRIENKQLGCVNCWRGLDFPNRSDSRSWKEENARQVPLMTELLESIAAHDIEKSVTPKCIPNWYKS